MWAELVKVPFQLVLCTASSACVPSAAGSALRPFAWVPLGERNRLQGLGLGLSVGAKLQAPGHITARPQLLPLSPQTMKSLENFW